MLKQLLVNDHAHKLWADPTQAPPKDSPLSVSLTQDGPRAVMHVHNVILPSIWYWLLWYLDDCSTCEYCKAMKEVSVLRLVCVVVLGYSCS